MANLTLYELTEQMQALEDILFENGGEYTPEIEEALGDNREALARKADGYNALLQRWQGVSENCAREIKRLQALKKVVENSLKNTKGHILDVMTANGMARLEGNCCKFMVRKNPDSLEVDETLALFKYQDKIEELRRALPEWATIEVKVSKTVIKEQGKSNGGVYPEGCSFSSSQSLTIK